MITRIEATRYRCFDRLDVDLGGFGVLVGANGAGKTTLLDIPVLLGDLLEHSGKQSGVGAAFLEALQPRGARASTFTDLLHKGEGERFAFAIEAQLPKSVVDALVESASGFVKENAEHWPAFIRYELGLEVFNKRELQVTSEYVFAFSEKDVPPRADKEDINAIRIHGEVNPSKRWVFALRREGGGEAQFRPEAKASGQSRRAPARSAAVPASRLALAALGFESSDQYPAARWLLQLLVEDAVFFDPNWAALRSASPPGLPGRVIADGLNLPWLAMALRAEARDQFDAWKEHVRIALPQLTDIEVIEREEDHHAYFRITYNNSYVVTSSGLSDGTLRVLALTLLPYLDSPPKLLVVEEPENGIHPRAIETVLEGLSSMNDTQVLVSSHSPVVVANTSIENLLAARLGRDGAVTVIPGSEHPRLVDWKGSIDLGTLFAAGVLG